MYVEMIETRSLKILLKSFHENCSDLIKKIHGRNEIFLQTWTLPVCDPPRECVKPFHCQGPLNKEYNICYMQRM